MMDEIITKSGFKYSFEPDAMDDLEVFELVRKGNDPDLPQIEKMHAMFEAFKLIIGEEQDNALRAYLKEKHGKVRTSDYKAEAEEIFLGLAKSKKK